MKKVFRIYGKVLRVSGMYLEATVPEGAVGNQAIVKKDNENIDGEIIGFHENKCLIMPFGSISGVKVGDMVWIRREAVSTVVGEQTLGQILDPLGRKLSDGKLLSGEKRAIELRDINPLQRERITEVFDSGIRTINALFTLGKGQKVGIFAGAGVGKTTLLGMITRFSKADVVVLGLIGERGREVREFVEDILGDALSKSVVIVTTADQTPIMKVKGAISALVHSRFFAEKGYDVLLILDSLTRFAMAQREVGLAAGEPPTLKGYTPSVFYLLSKVVESCGNFKKGSITGIFSVLVEGDDISLDPVADSLMGMFDGHIILSRKRANAGIFPAIDPVKSLSRLMPQLVSKDHMTMALYIKEMLSAYESMEELVNLGLYTQGTNPVVDKVIKHQQAIKDFFRQDHKTPVDFKESLSSLTEIYNKITRE
ncbi:FliI/YscN family ATPase [Thermocrinis sp.]